MDGGECLVAPEDCRSKLPASATAEREERRKLAVEEERAAAWAAATAAAASTEGEVGDTKEVGEKNSAGKEVHK